MLEKGTRVCVEGDDKVYTVMAAWKLDSFQKENNAIYGYELETRRGAVRIVVDTQLKEGNDGD